jgi:DNA-binding CsgD family transcriptional regulator
MGAPPYAHVETATEHATQSALPVLEALPDGIDDQQRTCILWTALGVPAKTVADNLGLSIRTIFNWRLKHREEIASMATVAGAVLARMARHRVAELVEIGSRVAAQYSARITEPAFKGKVQSTDLVNVARAAETMLHVAQGLAALQTKDNDTGAGSTDRVNVDHLTRVLGETIPKSA